MSTAPSPDRQARSESVRSLPDSIARDVPTVAWPTLGVLVLGVSIWGAGIGLALSGAIGAAAGVALAVVGLYVAFAAAHECAHYGAFRSRRLNTVVGAVLLVLYGPFTSIRAYRVIHGIHHANTNDRENDPDFWSGLGPRWMLPIRWLTQEGYYGWFYLKRIRSRPRDEVVEIVGTTVLLLAVYASTWALGLGPAATLYWIVPGRLVGLGLVITFNYVPHLPYDVSAAEDPRRATNIVQGWGMTPLFMFQNYHLIHHLYPGRVPFYRYRRVWEAQRSELVDHGARVLSLR